MTAGVTGFDRKNMKTGILETGGLAGSDVRISRLAAPLDAKTAWQVESLLVRIFERGDYSFRSALSGKYSGTLKCNVFLAKLKGQVVGAAICLYANRNPAIGLVGPVGVAHERRGRGIGKRLMTSLIDYAAAKGCAALYLGVSGNGAAQKLYSSFGFKRYQGIVMRRLMRPEADFDRAYFAKDADVRVRKAVWGDFAGVQALLSCPCDMYTFDIRRGVFSSKYVEPTRFLSVFPEMMSTSARHGGRTNILAAGPGENVVGYAAVCVSPTRVTRHVAELDFFVHDNFVAHCERLVRATLAEGAAPNVEMVNCRCLGCDRLKRNVIEALGGEQVAVLAGNVKLGDTYEDLLVYQLKGSK